MRRVAASRAESTGVHLGPAAYGRGEKCPTAADARVVLGYLSPQSLLGERLQIDAPTADELSGMM
jgi:N-methylhydantoinase A